MVRLILGSQSPRRKEILGYFSLPFEQVGSNYDEEAHPFKGNPGQYVCELACGKSAILQKDYPDAMIITADSVVYCNGKIFNKPKDENEAFEMLSELNGVWHSVFTGMCVSYQGKQYDAGEETRVLFNKLTPEQIRHYHSKIHWADRAGGYGIQMGGGLLVNRIDGCYYNVVGLPINTLRKLLAHFDIELWDYVK